MIANKKLLQGFFIGSTQRVDQVNVVNILSKLDHFRVPRKVVYDNEKKIFQVISIALIKGLASIERFVTLF
jgi:hypothetical protein